MKEIEGLKTDKSALMLRVRTMGGKPAVVQHSEDAVGKELQAQLAEKNNAITQLRKEKEAQTVSLAEKIKLLEQQNRELQLRLTDEAVAMQAGKKHAMHSPMKEEEVHHHVAKKAKLEVHVQQQCSNIAECEAALQSSDCPYFLRSRTGCLDDKENIGHQGNSLIN